VTIGLVVLATFLAAAVEWVEALTIVLAVGIVKSWRTALLATAAALGVLALLVFVFGFAVTSYVSVSTVRTIVGVGLLLFGLGWLYKAILRSSGLKALHDEAEAFRETREEVMTHGHAFGMPSAESFWKASKSSSSWSRLVDLSSRRRLPSGLSFHW
jgi:Ca2+/H+ antiporter, TMEM165/GDT1 family